MTSIPSINVSEINLVPLQKKKDGLTGFVSFVVNGFYIGNVAVMTRADGSGRIALSYPNRIVGGQQSPCVHPITKEVGETVTQAIQEKFDALFTQSLSEHYDKSLTPRTDS